MTQTCDFIIKSNLVIHTETGDGAFIYPNPVPPKLSVGDFGGRTEDRGGRRKRRTEGRKKARGAKGRGNDEED